MKVILPPPFPLPAVALYVAADFVFSVVVTVSFILVFLVAAVDASVVVASVVEAVPPVALRLLPVIAVSVGHPAWVRVNIISSSPPPSRHHQGACQTYLEEVLEFFNNGCAARKQTDGPPSHELSGAQ